MKNNKNTRSIGLAKGIMLGLMSLMLAWNSGAQTKAKKKSKAKTSIKRKENVDLLVKSVVIWAVDDQKKGYWLPKETNAIAVDKGKIKAIGSLEAIQAKYTFKKVWDGKGRYLMPGMVDAHCHFEPYGLEKEQANLSGCKSELDIIDRLRTWRISHPNAPAILGAGWNQLDFRGKRLPNNLLISREFPDVPVYCRRIDGHAALVNQFLLNKAGLSMESKIDGGQIIGYEGDEKIPSGVLIDAASDYVRAFLPEEDQATRISAIKAAQNDCIYHGLIGVCDAMSTTKTYHLADSLSEAGVLKIYFSGMVDAEDPMSLAWILNTGPIYKKKLIYNTVKVFVDGALGSRGALLLQPYADKPELYGGLRHPAEWYYELGKKLIAKNLKMSGHCVGDSAVHLLVGVFAKLDKEYPGKVKGWRIEHCQTISNEDMEIMRKLGIVASVQTSHVTSDHDMAIERLGPLRIRNAYRYGELKAKTTMIVGTDFPVEPINPMRNLEGAARRDEYFVAEEGALVRGVDNFIYPMELYWNMSGLVMQELGFKGTGAIQVGNAASFIFMDKNIEGMDYDEILSLKPSTMILDGEVIYNR